MEKDNLRDFAYYITEDRCQRVSATLSKVADVIGSDAWKCFQTIAGTYFHTEVYANVDRQFSKNYEGFSKVFQELYFECGSLDKRKKIYLRSIYALRAWMKKVVANTQDAKPIDGYECSLKFFKENCPPTCSQAESVSAWIN